MKNLVILVTLAFSLVTTSAHAGKILLTEFDYSGYTEMKTNLENAGHTVDIIDATVAGNIATALATNTYDQLFLWDLTNTTYLTAPDLTAISNFWSTDMGMVVDTRSYGYDHEPNEANGLQLLQNIAANLDLSGGGMWIGSDHDPGWAYNANLVLDILGFDAITGSFSDPVNFADPTSVLLDGVTPNNLWAAGKSVGKAPIGVQANGVEMFMHFGNNDNGVLPYISASFNLQGPNSNDIPEPGTLVLLSLALLFIKEKKILGH